MPPSGGGRPAPLPRGRTSWVAIGLGGAALLAAVALFAAAIVFSFDLLRAERAEKPTQPDQLLVAGDEETVFSWNRDACSQEDIPDLPARAFKGADGRVQLIAAHFENRRFIGPDLARLDHPCRVLMTSQNDPDPARFADREWIAAPYTEDGRTVYALVHDEYQGQQHPGQCPSGVYQKCWYNSVTLAVSRDGGRTYRHAARPPGHHVASLPYRYEPEIGPYGYFAPSNIVLNPDDGYHYAMMRAEKHGEQRYGTCLMRTKTLADPGSWRAWDGSGFDVRFADPYAEADVDPTDHVCAPVSPQEIGAMVESLTYNEYLGKWVLVGSSQDVVAGRGVVVGFYWSVSDDLVSWSHRKLIAQIEMPWSHECGDPNPVGYPSVIDPSSSARNFTTTGEEAYLYFTRFHYRNCVQTLNRDLVRVPIRFAK